jgi:hypothetical protein
VGAPGGRTARLPLNTGPIIFSNQIEDRMDPRRKGERAWPKPADDGAAIANQDYAGAPRSRNRATVIPLSERVSWNRSA